MVIITRRKKSRPSNVKRRHINDNAYDYGYGYEDINKKETEDEMVKALNAFNTSAVSVPTNTEYKQRTQNNKRYENKSRPKDDISIQIGDAKLSFSSYVPVEKIQQVLDIVRVSSL